MPLIQFANAQVTRLFNRFKPYTRTIKAGQLAYVYVTRHGGVTDVPKYGAWVEIVQVHEDHCVCRLVARDSRSRLHHNVGFFYRCAKNTLQRPPLPALLAWEQADLDAATGTEQALFRRLQAFVTNCNETTSSATPYHGFNFVEQYLNAIYGNANSRLAERFANQETRKDSRYWTAQYVPSQSRAAYWKHHREDLRKLGQRHSQRLKAIAALTTASDAAALRETLRNTRVDNRFVHTSTVERALLTQLLDKIKTDWGLVYGSCGHLAPREELTLTGSNGSLCPACVTRNTEMYGPLLVVLNPEGDTVRVFRQFAFTWEDGTLRSYAEPPVIGSYHSHKSTFTKSLPHITGQQPHKSVLKVGYELEFVRGRNPQHSDDYYVRDMRKRITEAVGSIIGTQPYCGFERDGSVDFELVSGYGPLDIHRAAVIGLLQGNPYGEALASHNGGRCGLHVHVDKPQSLMHAVRLQAFYNNPFNERLVRSVARRYQRDSGYAKIKANKGDMKAAANVYKNQTDSYATRAARIKRAITRLTDERYEVVNYTNANTAEIRVFRGSMIVNTVIACLEFAFMSWYFTRDTTLDQLTTDNFLSFISLPEWRHETQYLRRYLWGKGFKVWMPRKQERRATVEA